MINVRAVGSTFIISAGGVVAFKSSEELFEGVAGEVVAAGVVRVQAPNLRGGARLSWASHGSAIISVGYPGRL